MRESVRLGTIAGVRVGINWSVVAIFLLVAVGLAGGRFPLMHPGRPAASYAAAGLVAAILFLLSLLAHEIAHAVVARRHGLQVDGITLWLFGGVARLGGEAADPSADLRVAGVGPLVSVALGVVFGAISMVVELASGPGLVVGVFGWLTVINFALAAFNLVPAAPLDGGRILRAILWKRRGDRTSAAVTAARAGRMFGLTLIGVGLLDFIVTAALGGLWLVLIGWFLTTAAGAEEQQAKEQGALSGVRVRDVMTADPTTVRANLSVQDLLDDYVMRHRHSSFPLLEEGGRPGGLVTLGRMKQVLPEARATTPVRTIACPPDEVPMAAPDDPLAALLARMAGCADGRALIVEHGRVVGIVSPTDVSRAMKIADLRDRRPAAHH